MPRYDVTLSATISTTIEGDTPTDLMTRLEQFIRDINTSDEMHTTAHHLSSGHFYAHIDPNAFSHAIIEPA